MTSASPKILIVEDEGITVLLLRKILVKQGFFVTGTVATGEQAISSVEQNPPDLILLDIRLAGAMDGLEVARKLRAQKSIKLIFLSGYDDPEIKKQALEFHPVAFLTKPINSKELLHLINKVFAAEDDNRT